jgi:hypothetical protein
LTVPSQIHHPVSDLIFAGLALSNRLSLEAINLSAPGFKACRARRAKDGKKANDVKKDEIRQLIA